MHLNKTIIEELDNKSYHEKQMVIQFLSLWILYLALDNFDPLLCC